MQVNVHKGSGTIQSMYSGRWGSKTTRRLRLYVPAGMPRPHEDLARDRVPSLSLTTTVFPPRPAPHSHKPSPASLHQLSVCVSVHSHRPRSRRSRRHRHPTLYTLQPAAPASTSQPDAATVLPPRGATVLPPRGRRPTHPAVTGEREMSTLSGAKLPVNWAYDSWIFCGEMVSSTGGAGLIQSGGTRGGGRSARVQVTRGILVKNDGSQFLKGIPIFGCQNESSAYPEQLSLHLSVEL